MKNLKYILFVLLIALSFAAGTWYRKLHSANLSTTVSIKHETMEQRLSVITLGVDNLPAQVEFYKSKLGWKAVAENKDIVFFKMNGFLFSMMDRKALAEGSGVKADGNGFRSLTISQNFSTKDEVDQLFKKLKSEGVKIIKEPSPTPFGGYFFIFSDLENNVLEAAYNPYVPLDEKGDVITHNNIDNL